MKRAREEVEEQAAPMVPSPTCNPGPAMVAPPPSGSGGPRGMTKDQDDAIAFVLRIWDKFDRAMYHEFFDVLRQIDSIGVRGVLDRINVLLRGYPDLKRHFNMFLPTQYKLSITDYMDQQGGADRPIVID